MFSLSDSVIIREGVSQPAASRLADDKNCKTFLAQEENEVERNIINIKERKGVGDCG